MTDMFGGMTVNQPPKSQQPSQEGNLFGNMTVKSQPPQQSAPVKKPEDPDKPKDAWSMGANLINF